MNNSTRPRDEEELVEGRQHNRFRVYDGGFAAVCPEFTALGQIIDISKSGLSFRYVASEARTNGSSKLSILLTDWSFCFDKIPFETIWDTPKPREFSFGAITLRQCGVQFGDLTPSQRLDLEYFIRSYTLFKERKPLEEAPQEVIESKVKQEREDFSDVVKGFQAYMSFSSPSSHVQELGRD